MPTTAPRGCSASAGRGGSTTSSASPPTTTLRRHVAALEESSAGYVAQTSGPKGRRYKEFHDAAASWDRVERIIARVEAGPLGVDARFVVTSLTPGSPRRSLRRCCQFDTMRLPLFKLAVRIEVLSKSVRLHLPRSSRDQAILAYALARLPRLVI